MSICYLNGQFLPLEQASVSVMDRGFLFGDGVYEVVPVFAGRPFRLTEHLQRLHYSLAQIELPSPYSDEQWASLFDELIERNGGGDQALYLQLTRGVAPVRAHRFPDEVTPTVFAMTRAIAPAAQQIPAPITAVTAEDIRWARCDIKSTSLLGNVLLTQQAIDADAQEVLLEREGLVWEGGSSNLFAVLDGKLFTPPKCHEILGGITRDLLVELAVAHHLKVVEAPIPTARLADAEELWITSSTREMVAVTELNGRAVANGEIGPIYKQLWAWYCDYRDTYMRPLHN